MLVASDGRERVRKPIMSRDYWCLLVALRVVLCSVVVECWLRLAARLMQVWELGLDDIQP